jgi:hypothetical protein
VNELVDLVAAKVGISPQQAEQAVHTVLGFLKDKLPEPVGGYLDHFIGGGTAGAGGAGGLDLGAIEGALGGLFGKK